MEAASRGALQRATSQLAFVLLVVCVTTGCGYMGPGGGNGGGNPLMPTPTAIDAGFYLRSVRLPQVVNRAGRSTSRFGSSRGGVTKQALNADQATELALQGIAILADDVFQALEECPIESSGPILCPVETAYSCDLGGRVEVHGNWSGGIDSAGLGQLLLDSTETVTDCHFEDGLVVNGDPALTLSATVNTDGSGTFRFGGGLKWVEPDGSAGSCQVSVTAIVDATGGEVDSGTVCNIDVNTLESVNDVKTPRRR
jgi:hypothetical protein